MDEPTDSLTEKEMEKLFAIIGDLKSKGITLVYITHYLEEVFWISDRITILKDGRKIATLETADADRGRIVSLMVGKEYSRSALARSAARGREVLRVEGLTSEGAFKNVSLSAYAGEILGITGVIGSGKTELARAVFGADRIDSGKVYLDGRAVRIASPADALAHGMGMLPEDRKTLGLILDQSVKVNVSLSSLGQFSKGGLIDTRKEESAVAVMTDRLGVKAASILQRVKFLSGGNQQKLIIAKWLMAGLRLIIMDEPTRGIDIGSKQAIYRIMRDLADQGTCILFISSEIPEIVEICDRMLVMKEGGISCEFSAGVGQEEVMHKVLEEEAV
ncbi:MAG: sugar ABC transporter ATP-binding protein [Candidatus Moduliflexus flocculans]|nr:sugar ABC transporter ATP-binding protein [Candidatus Moduliflexus flocculans]